MARNIHNGSLTDDSMSKISMADEDHTFAIAIGFPSYKDPRVTCCGYSIPHPSDNQVKIRVQTTVYGIVHSHRQVIPLKDACQDLMFMCQHGRRTFDKVLVDYEPSKLVGA